MASGPTPLGLGIDIQNVPNQVGAVIKDLDSHRGVNTLNFGTIKKQMESLLNSLKDLETENANESIEWGNQEDDKYIRTECPPHDADTLRPVSPATTLGSSTSAPPLKQMVYKLDSSLQSQDVDANECYSEANTRTASSSWSLNSWSTGCLGW
jgi:hypothetical protein